MDGVPQTSLTEEELKNAELMMEEMEREIRGGQPPNEGGGEQPPEEVGGQAPDGEGGRPPDGEGGPPHGEGGPPPNGGGGEEERVTALREGDWTDALKLVQEALTERGQAEGIFGRDFDRVEPGDSPVAKATDGHCRLH